MAVTVLVVDDSRFFRKRIIELLRSFAEVEVVGTAANGREAIEKNKELSPDVITMDYEMPMMDGITAIKQIMQEKPTSILMFSSLTFEGARVTLDALEAGALDYLPKSFESMSPNAAATGRILTDKILAVVKKKDRKENLERSSDSLSIDRAFMDANDQGRPTSASPSSLAAAPSPSPQPSSVSRSARTSAISNAVSLSPVSSIAQSRSPASWPGGKPSLLVIGASTGGPVALQTVLKELPANFPVPILVIQHMPEAFTAAFAERLNQFCKITVKEAVDGDLMKPGEALIAPGGKQMLVTGSGVLSVKILDSDERLQYKPSVDVTFGSAAKALPGKVLALVLTGMGADGREGAKLLNRGNSRVWTQDEASCVVYGMPMAIKTAELSDAEVKIADMGSRLKAEFKCGST